MVGLAELETLLPEDASEESVETVFRTARQLGILVVNEETRRPVGFHPGWDARLWDATLPGGPGWTAEDLDDLAALARGEDPDRARDEAAASGPEAEEGVAGEAGGPALEPPHALYLKELDEVSALAPEEEAELLTGARLGDEARRQRLLVAYLPRVVRLARRYAKAGAERDDLISAGNLGLVEALATFETTGTSTFASFAERCIRRSMARHMAEERRTVRLPRGTDKEVRRLLRADEVLRKRLGRPPSQKELAAELELGETEVAYLMHFLRAPLSLQGKGEGGEDATLEETLADQRAPDPAEANQRIRLLETLKGVADELGPGHLEVLALRFGLADGVACTRKETARRTGLGFDEVRRLESEALDVLRAAAGRNSEFG